MLKNLLILLFSLNLIIFPIYSASYHRMNTLFNTHKLKNHFAIKNKLKYTLNNPKL